MAHNNNRSFKGSELPLFKKIYDLLINLKTPKEMFFKQFLILLIQQIKDKSIEYKECDKVGTFTTDFSDFEDYFQAALKGEDTGINEIFEEHLIQCKNCIKVLEGILEYLNIYGIGDFESFRAIQEVKKKQRKLKFQKIKMTVKSKHSNQNDQSNSASWIQALTD